MSNSDVECSEESLESIDDSSDISDEEKKLCSTLISLQPHQLERESESGRESESEFNNDINKQSTTKHLEARGGNWCECGKCSVIRKTGNRLFVLPRSSYNESLQLTIIFIFNNYYNYCTQGLGFHLTLHLFLRVVTKTE